MESIWLHTAKLPKFERLERKIKTDVLIIGGGLAGLLCAYALSKEGIDYVLIEAERIGAGTTGYTTAKITSQHGLIYSELFRRFGAEKTRMYLEANESALEQYRKLAQGIDCDFEEKDSAVYSTDRKDRIEQELDTLERIGYSADGLTQLPIPISIEGAVRFKRQAQFNPLKFLQGIVPGLNIYEGTAARAFEGRTVRTEKGSIRAEQIIVATHFPLFNKHGAYFLKMYQDRSYVLALERGPDMGGMYRDEKKTGFSFRNYQGMLLLGGGSHRTGKQSEGWKPLSEFASRHYPGARERYRWAAQDCITLDSMPYIGRYAKGIPGVYVATGFNKWGMTSSMIAAGMLCDMVQGKKNPYESLFSPSRSILHPQLAINAIESAGNLLTPTRPRCPHMGCALKWNKQERSWDCPCHGSRFSGRGELLNDPATDDLSL